MRARLIASFAALTLVASGGCAKGTKLGSGHGGSGGATSASVTSVTSATTVGPTTSVTKAATTTAPATTSNTATTGTSTGSGMGCNDPCVVGPPESLSKCASSPYADCITQVCQALSTCCSSAWDSSCIEKTKTVGACGVDNVHC